MTPGIWAELDAIRVPSPEEGKAAIDRLFRDHPGRIITSSEVAHAHGHFSHDRQRRRVFEELRRDGWRIVEYPPKKRGGTWAWAAIPPTPHTQGTLDFGERFL